MTPRLPRRSRTRSGERGAGGAAMLAGRAPLGAAGCGRLLAAGLLRPLLCWLPPCWVTAARQYPSLRVAEAVKEKRPVRKEQRSSLVVRRFIACPQLARTVRRCLQGGAGPGPQPLLLEFAPGELPQAPARPSDLGGVSASCRPRHRPCRQPGPAAGRGWGRASHGISGWGGSCAAVRDVPARIPAGGCPGPAPRHLPGTCGCGPWGVPGGAFMQSLGNE